MVNVSPHEVWTLVEDLREGVVYHDGGISEAATDKVMQRAAEMIESLWSALLTVNAQLH